MLSQLKEIEEPARVAVLAALLPDGEAGGSTDEPLAESYLLAIGNYPNPFNPVTTITYTLPSRSHVNLVVYDLLGREVAELVNEVREPGVHTVPFDASALSSGIYLYRLTAGNQVFTNRMTLIK